MVISQETHLFVTALKNFLEAVEQQPLSNDERKFILTSLEALHMHLGMEEDDGLKVAA